MYKLEAKGPCRPGKFFGCKCPISTEALSMVVQSLPTVQGIAHLYIRGDPLADEPAEGIKYLNALLSQSGNEKFGMFHWVSQSSIVVRREALVAAVEQGLFKSGDTYQRLITALKKLGLDTYDLD